LHADYIMIDIKSNTSKEIWINFLLLAKV